MTSPSVDLDSIMPYGLNVSANTSSTYIHPDGDSSRIDGSFILLPVGPCQVQFTWPGKQDAYVRWVDSSINEKGIPIEISGGGGVFPKDRYHRRSPRRQTTGAHPLQRQSWHDRNYHGVPHAPITTGVVKHDHPKHRPGLGGNAAKGSSAAACMERHDSACDEFLPGRNLRPHSPIHHPEGNKRNPGREFVKVYRDSQDSSGVYRVKCRNGAHVSRADSSGVFRGKHRSVPSPVGISKHQRPINYANWRANNHDSLAAATAGGNY
mgnify:CR=1 FL=1